MKKLLHCILYQICSSVHLSCFFFYLWTTYDVKHWVLKIWCCAICCLRHAHWAYPKQSVISSHYLSWDVYLMYQNKNVSISIFILKDLKYIFLVISRKCKFSRKWSHISRLGLQKGSLKKDITCWETFIKFDQQTMYTTIYTN